MYGLFFFSLIAFSLFLLSVSQPKGRLYGLVAGLVGVFMGSSVGVASGGSATSGTLLFGMIFFIAGSIFGNRSDAALTSAMRSNDGLYDDAKKKSLPEEKKRPGRESRSPRGDQTPPRRSESKETSSRMRDLSARAERAVRKVAPRQRREKTSVPSTSGGQKKDRRTTEAKSEIKRGGTLAWMRTAGDAGRLSLELQRFGAPSNSLPPAMMEEIVAAVQARIDKLNASPVFKMGFSQADFQYFFDKSFELAAAVPLFLGVTPEVARSALGEERYGEVYALVYGGKDSIHSELVQDLVKICKAHTGK